MSVMLSLIALLTVACTDNIELDNSGVEGGGDVANKGEMIFFSAGTTSTISTTRADGKTYYMPQGGRFVCRMYHKTQAGSENFDISNPEDAWLTVNNEIGNSVYWKKNFANASDLDSYDNLDSYGNDNDATYLYWRNRRPHAFLAWTDNNKLGAMTFSTGVGGLKFAPYDVIVTTNEKKKAWLDMGYQIYGVNETESSVRRTFNSWLELKTYVEGLSEDELSAFNTAQSGFSEPGTFGQSYYEYGWSCKYFVSDQPDVTVDGIKTSAWIKYLMYYEKFEYTPTGSEVKQENKDGVVLFLKDANGNYLAEVIYDDDDTEHANPHYYKTDIHGNVRYDEDRPKFTFYMKRISKEQDAEIHDEYRANKFDLTRGTKDAMSQQPDILQALVIKEPASAALQANRIDLYFKHQFSQVQVNIKNSEDNSVTIEPGQIDKVELLGVTDEGYVFTELLPNGEVRPTSYKDVVATDYTDAQLEVNPYGTSFQMFDRKLTEDEKTTTKAIKSYECITFGLLQAIRITWHETEDEGNVFHASTYRVGDLTLRNLASGVRYIWNMELRRGTLAVVRTEIIPWEENLEDYRTDGMIQK